MKPTKRSKVRLVTIPLTTKNLNVVVVLKRRFSIEGFEDFKSVSDRKRGVNEISLFGFRTLGGKILPPRLTAWTVGW
jgi:hypothetical protein